MEKRPRYKQLADELMADIRSGRLRVGETLPGEHELVEQFGVSRHTVREALRRLGELGLIERQQGIGTHVKARRSSASYVHAVRSPAELLQYPPDARLATLASGEIRADRRLARLLDCPGGTRWHRVSAVRRFRSARRPPLCWVEIYLWPELAGAAGLIDRNMQRIFETLERRQGEELVSVGVEIRAGLIAGERAEALQVASGSPSLTVIRRYLGRGERVFAISVSEHPADRYSYGLELRRGWQSGTAWSAH